MQIMQTVQEPVTTEAPANGQAWLDQLGERIAADPDARFAISLDRLAYAKDSYQLGVDLVRIYARRAAINGLPGTTAGVTTLLHGMKVLTGQTSILGRRYGSLAVEAREAGGSLFDFETDDLARAVVIAIAAADPDLSRKVGERSGSPVPRLPAGSNPELLPHT